MPAEGHALRLLMLIQFTSMGAMEMSGPFWPLQVQSLLGPEGDQSVALLATMVYVGPMLAAMLLTPLWGRLGDRAGHKPMIVRALLALALCQGLAAVTVDPWLLVAIRVMQGALAGFLAAAQAYAVACCDLSQRGQTLARLQSATAVGSLIGPLAGGVLLDVAGFAVLCYGAALVCLACALGSCFLPADTPRAAQGKAGVRVPLPKGWLGAIALVIILIQAAKMMPQPFYALYVTEVLQAPGWLIGASYAASAATLAISAPFWGRLFDRWQSVNTLRAIESVAWLCAFTMVTTALVHEWVGLLLTRLLWGIWQGALLPVAYVLIASSLPSHQLGFALGLGNSAAKAGALLGVAMGGIGLGLVGLANSFWLVAPVYVLAAIAIRWARASATSSVLPVNTHLN
ncbi:Multidrug resistance protein MdtG [compost metagenome]